MAKDNCFLLIISVFLAYQSKLAFGNNNTTIITSSSSVNTSSSMMNSTQAVTSTYTLAMTSSQTTNSATSTTSASTIQSSTSTATTADMSQTQQIKPSSADMSQTQQIKPSSTQSSPSSSTQATPINGNWSSWSAWSTCTKSCNNGTQYKTRTCTNPSPQNNGMNCTGSDRETRHCNTGTCPVREFNVSMRITNKEYVTELADTRSPQYNNLKYKVETAIKAIYANDPTFQRMDDLVFTQGSVIVSFVLVFGPSNSSSSQDPAVLLEQAVSVGSLADLTIDKNSFTITESAQGTTIRSWETDVSFCKSQCCVGTPGQIWQNRTCIEGSSSCSGILLARKIKCEKTECVEQHCVPNAVTMITMSPLTIITAVLCLFLTVL